MRSQIPRPSDIVPAPHAWGGERALAASSAELVLALDAAGVIQDLILPDRALARDLAGYTEWIGTRWDDRVTPESRAEVEALRNQAIADPVAAPAAAPWRLVEHVARRGEVIPLLCTVLPRSSPDAPFVALGRDLLHLDLARLALRHDAAVVRAYARATLARGGGVPESLCLDVLAPAANRIGGLWSDDRCDSLAVAEAVGRLRGALEAIPAGPGRALGAEGAPAFGPLGRRRALLSLAAGEEHNLGLAMLARFLEWAGWEVHVAGEAAEVPALLRGQAFDLLGFSAASTAAQEGLGAAIRTCRRASRHRGLKVMVGGAAFLARPGLATEVGADALALDARQAVLVADSLVPAGPRRA